MTTYREWQPTVAPAWIDAQWSEAFGLAKDSVADIATQAVKSRLIATCPTDAIVPIGNDRGLERVPGETTASYRARLVGAWEAYAWAGTAKGILDQLAIAGYSNVRILENESIGGSDADPSKWWRFIVRILQPHPFGDGSTIPRYGDGTTYGGGRTYGGIPIAARDLIRRIIRKWKPAHARCLRVEVVLSGRLYGDGLTYGAGTTYGGAVVRFSV